MKKLLFLFIVFIVHISLSSAQTTKDLHIYENTTHITYDNDNYIYLHLDIDGYTPGQCIIDTDAICSICVNIEHSNLDNLEIYIECPNGQTMMLVEHNSGNAFLGEPILDGNEPGNGYNYCWTPSSVNGTFGDISNNFTTIPEGDYTADDFWEQFIGCPYNTNWHLRIRDNNPFDDGYIFSWSIEFCEQITEISNYKLNCISNNTYVHPNPCTNFINFDLDNNNYIIEIFNIYGQNVCVVNSDSNPKTTISTEGLKNGIYFYTITSSNCEIKTTGKFLINN